MKTEDVLIIDSLTIEAATVGIASGAHIEAATGWTRVTVMAHGVNHQMGAEDFVAISGEML